MLQTIYCECGESLMVDGRCVKCQRVRPSSLEIIDEIISKARDITKAESRLKKALEMEAEDNQKKGTNEVKDN